LGDKGASRTRERLGGFSLQMRRISFGPRKKGHTRRRDGKMILDKKKKRGGEKREEVHKTEASWGRGKTKENGSPI